MSVINSFRLDGKVAIVTGGGGLYGVQIVHALAEAGARTVIASRGLDAIREQAARMQSEGLKVSAEQLDQGCEESIHSLRDKVARDIGPASVLINNAVLRTMSGWSCPGSAFEQSMHVNATGVFLMTRVFGEQMGQADGGSIINIGSIQGSVAPDFSLYEGLDMDAPPDYFFHKGGMVQLTRYAAACLGPKGVRVNTLSPGGYNPDLPAKFVERYNRRTCLGRMANENDIQGAVVFLASDASAYITGANIPVDGGYTAI